MSNVNPKYLLHSRFILTPTGIYIFQQTSRRYDISDLIFSKDTLPRPLTNGYYACNNLPLNVEGQRRCLQNINVNQIEFHFRSRRFVNIRESLVELNLSTLRCFPSQIVPFSISLLSNSTNTFNPDIVGQNVEWNERMTQIHQ